MLDAEENIKMNPPIKTRSARRPSVKRKIAWDEPQYQSKVYKCSRCGSTGHNKSTCKGGDVGQNPKGKRPRTQMDVATFTNFDTHAPAKSKAKKKSTNCQGVTSQQAKKKTTPASTSKIGGTSKKQQVNHTFSGVIVSVHQTVNRTFT